LLDTTKLRELTLQQLDALFEGVTSVDLVDFPDYPNVGDSAIALGLLDYFTLRGIRVESARSIQTLGATRTLKAATVVINGGGNLGGLYPLADKHREQLIEELPSATQLIQAPQTIDVTGSEGLRVLRAFARRRNTRLAVRDESSANAFEAVGGAPFSSPDSAHILELDSPGAASQHVLPLIRTDGESRKLERCIDGREDWLRDDPIDLLRSKIRRQFRRAGSWGHIGNPSLAKWRQIADSRVRRGLRQLARGEIVLTDRLHAMILANSIGRPVVAVDNSTKKLTRYLEKWDLLDDVTVAESFEAAAERLAS
jgi:pyruvyl transferase EpsO